MGVDIKPIRGHLKIDSRKLLKANTGEFDVIDIDVYGSPLRYLDILLPLIKKQIILFLTFGKVGGWGYDRIINNILGIKFDIPPTIGASINSRFLEEILAGQINKFAKIIECRESPCSRNARYIGVVVFPKKRLDEK